MPFIHILRLGPWVSSWSSSAWPRAIFFSRSFRRVLLSVWVGVKSTSRFARNTTDYIRYVRELLRLGISICFEKENIDTGKMTSEQIAQIYGAFS